MEEQKEIDPLEAQLAAETKAEQSNPLDLHAQYFYMYFPRFRQVLNNLNKKALIRLISFLVENPLNERELRSCSKLEQDAFQIGDQLLVSKYLMMIVTDLKMQDELKTKQEAEKKALDNETQIVVDSKNEMKEGENNG